MRVAEMLGVTIEVVRQSDVLSDVGGVGCLLRFGAPKQDESDRAE